MNCLMLLLCATQEWQDCGPDMPNGTVQGRACTAGVMYALAGDENILYGVSLNAGVWKSEKGGPWKQLPNSPPRATSIAVDPKDARHVAVGERNGDAVRIEWNQAGLWESKDAGATWEYIFDPLSRGAKSQAIPAVAFTRADTLLIGSAAGIGRRAAGSDRFEFPANPGLVTAFAESDLLWARTNDVLLVSSDDGKTWKTLAIPDKVDGYGTRGWSRGDAFALAAFRKTAILLFVPDDKTEKAKLTAFGNHNGLLYYDAEKDRWWVQVLDSGNGTGLGGRRSLKTIGSRQYFIGGQDLMVGDGTEWKRLALTECGEPGADPIHPDLWDVWAQGDIVRVVSDGGVHKRTAEGRWVTHNEGLFTQHIHTVTVLPKRLVYSTSDNSEWFRDTTWRTWDMTGDSNWTDGDAANPALALIARHQACALLTDFEQTPPKGAQRTRATYSTLYYDGPNEQVGFGPQTCRFIQTLKNETVPPLLDAVMLATLPLHYHDGAKIVPVSEGPLAKAKSKTGGPVLLRNRRFAASPDINISKYAQDWTLEADDLPVGTKKMWVSGGHERPIYDVLTVEGDDRKLHRRTSAGWIVRKFQGRLLDTYAYGPVFVNPYDPKHLLLLTSEGVQATTDGGETFRREEVLTALITGCGTYPLVGAYPGGNGHDVVMASRANSMATLAHVVFDRNAPRTMVAASPFTGVFYFDGTVWRNLGAFLPRPFTPVSSVGSDETFIYVATEGRGLYRISDYRKAPRATYFDGLTLRDASGKPLTKTPLKILIGKGGAVATRTDDRGTVTIPSDPADAVIHLRYEGNSEDAPCERWLSP